jgi:hypothetical protein
VMFMTKNSFGYRNPNFPYIERSVQAAWRMEATE